MRFRPTTNGARGQAAVMMFFAVTAVLGMAAVVIDTGNIYQAHQELSAASDAAALAAAYDIPTTTTAQATTDATTWSATAGSKNISSKLTDVAITVSYKCLTTVNIACLATPTSPVKINAVQVLQTAKVKSIFAEILGIHTFNISATSTAIHGGGTPGPVNLMLVLDTTESMSTVDTNCTVPGKTNPTREQCAVYAVRTLLSDLNPCASTLSSCGTVTNGNVANPVGQVGLMVFPGITPAETGTLNNPPVQAPTSSDDYACPASNPSITSYNNNPGYLVLPLQSDYRASDSATSLSQTSNLVTAVGGNTCSNGVTDPGGEGTFYAGAIAAAQAYLTANTRSNVKNVMILLSDGDATASSTQMRGSATSYTATNECHQAITAAANAQAAGILIYSVAYGAEASGCTTDSPAITPCQTMESIASTPTANYFFSDVNQSGSGGDSACVNASRPISTLNEAFGDVSSDLSYSRLVPNNTQ